MIFNTNMKAMYKIIFQFNSILQFNTTVKLKLNNNNNKLKLNNIIMLLIRILTTLI